MLLGFFSFLDKLSVQLENEQRVQNRDLPSQMEEKIKASLKENQMIFFQLLKNPLYCRPIKVRFRSDPSLAEAFLRSIQGVVSQEILSKFSLLCANEKALTPFEQKIADLEKNENLEDVAIEIPDDLENRGWEACITLLEKIPALHSLKLEGFPLSFERANSLNTLLKKSKTLASLSLSLRLNGAEKENLDLFGAGLIESTSLNHLHLEIKREKPLSKKILENLALDLESYLGNDETTSEDYSGEISESDESSIEGESEWKILSESDEESEIDDKEDSDDVFYSDQLCESESSEASEKEDLEANALDSDYHSQANSEEAKPLKSLSLSFLNLKKDDLDQFFRHFTKLDHLKFVKILSHEMKPRTLELIKQKIRESQVDLRIIIKDDI